MSLDHYVTLGRSGLRVSPFCLGAMTFGEDWGWGSSVADAEAIQTEVYEVGKRHGFTELRAWFKALYEILLGQTQGPRMGSFIALYGRDESVALIRRVAAGETVGTG